MTDESQPTSPKTHRTNFHQAVYHEPLLIEKQPGNKFKNQLPPTKTPADIPPPLRRKDAPNIPNLSELDVVRHYTRLSQMNWGVDTGFYPLGSCTMKYNLKLPETMATSHKMSSIHPSQDQSTIQGVLRIMYELQNFLAEIGGMDAVSLQPAAGAQGEYAGLHVARAFHEKNGEGAKRNQVIVPDTSHGTNPASAAMVGYETIEIPSVDGCVSIEALKAAISDRTAVFMLTNPNTLGIFEDGICEIAKIVHEAGALLYYDGANLNALFGRAKPGLMGFDIMHFNLHKTFGTPHGGGGPGAGPIGVKAHLAPFLPVPVVSTQGPLPCSPIGEVVYKLDYDSPDSIGPMKSYYGNFAVLFRAYVYVKMLGWQGLRESTNMAVLNSNYMRKRLGEMFDMPFRQLRKHEFVLSGERYKERGFSTLDIAKRLIDYGFHPPTIYFPHLVPEALMIEPTESEGKDVLDSFVEALLTISGEDPALIRGAPTSTSVGRLDEKKAAKDLTLTWKDMV